jgi:hypothetical protein
MPITQNPGGGITATGKDGIEAYRYAILIVGLKSEIRGMRLTAKGRTCYSILKSLYGFKGSREKVLQLAEAYRDEVLIPNLHQEVQS